MDGIHLARFHTAGRRSLVAFAVMAALASTAPVRAATLTWGTTGTGGTGNWDLSTSPGWWNGSSNIAWVNANNDIAYFGGTAGTVTLTTGITTNGMIFDTTGYTVTGNTLTFAGSTPTITTNTGVTATVSSILAGSVALTKSGGGTLTLSGANTLSGNMTISSGTVIANSTVNNSNPTATSLGNMTTVGRTITTSTGATLLFQASDAIGQYNYATPVTLIADGGTITRVANTTTFNSIGSLTLQNGGRLTTTNGNASTVGSFAINGTVTVQGTSGSFIDTLSGQNTNSFINLGTNGTGVTTFNVGSTGDPTADLTVSAVLGDKVLGGAAGLTKTGAGKMISSARNTFTGTTTVSAGTLQLNDARSMSGAAVVGSGATLTIQNNGNGGYYQPSLLDVTTATVNNASNGSSRYHGIYTEVINAHGGSSTITLPLYMDKAGDGLSHTQTVTVDSGASLSISGVISAHPDVNTATNGKFTKNGAGTLTLSGGNTFKGNVTINSGTLNVSYTANNTSPTATALGDMTTTGKTVTTSTGATLNFVNSDAIGQYNYTTPVTLIADGGTITRSYSASMYFNSLGDVQLKNGGRLTTNNGNSSDVQSFGLNGNVTVSGTSGSFIDTVGNSFNGINLATGTTTGTTTFTVNPTGDATADLTVSAPLADKTLGGAALVLKAGAGTMRISSANSYSGGTTLRAGTIVAANNNALSSAGTVTINDASTGSSNTSLLIGGSYTIGRAISVANQGSGSVTIGSTGLAGSDQAVYSGAITLAKDVTLQGSGGDRTQFSGGIGGTGNVTVAGAGRTLFLTAVNGYAGTTTINGTSTLQLSDGSATANSLLPDNYAVTVSGALKLAKGGNSETIDALLGAGNVQAVSGADTLIVGNANGSGTFSGVIQNNGGTLAFTKNGTGTQVLTGANTYTGATTVSSGTLQVGDASTTGSIASNAAVSTGAALAFRRSDAVTYSGTVSGAGTLVQVGSGTLTLTANNTYTGTTSLAAGVLALGSSGAIGSSGTITFSGGTLQYSASNQTDYSNRFSTAASQAFSIDTNGQAVTLGTALTSSGATLAKLGSGTLTLTANNTYSGATNVSAGVLQIGSGGATGAVAGPIANSGTVVFNRSGALSIGGIISGAGSLVQAGSGTTTLSGVNTYSGVTTITGGMLSVGNDSNLGTAPGSATPGSIVINGGSLAFTSAFTLATNRGIALGPASGPGSGTIDVAAGQVLTYGGIIANNGGTGSLVKVGDGTLKLSAAATYTGSTSINAGTLQLDGGSLASPTVAVASGATLGGRGTVSTVTVAGGGGLAPGVVGSGTLTTGTLTFSGAATVTMGAAANGPLSRVTVLGDVTASGGTGSVVFAFGNNLSLINTGTYSLLTYTGNLSDTSAFGYSGSTGGRQSVAVSGTTVAGAVSLVIGNAFPIWTGTDGTDWFGAGNWKLNTTGSATNFQNLDTVDFNDSALLASGTVVISGSNATSASVTFSANTKAYTIEATGGFGISTGAVVKTGSALVTITNANTYSGGTTLSLGRLRVGDNAALGSGTISFFGPAALSSDSGSARTLANGIHIDDDVTLGDATDNGALTLSGTITFDGNVHTIATPSNVTLSGLVTAGGLIKTGTGVLAITGSNNYAGGTTLSAGTLRVGNDAAFGTAGVTLNGGVLSSNDTSARTLTAAFTLGGDVTLGDATNTGALTLGSVGGVNLGGSTRQVTTPSNVTFAGAVTNGGLTKLGGGTLTLSSANSYADGTTLSAGDIALGNVGALGSGTATYAGAGTIRNTVAGTVTNAMAVNAGISGTFDSAANATTLSGAVANAGTFTLTTTATQTLAGVVSGSGALVKAGGGTVVLSATSTYTGDTTISAGTFEVGGAGLLGGGSYAGVITNAGTLSITSSAAQTLSGAISNAGTVAVNSSGNQTISGVVSGVGSLTKTGAGTLTLSNASNSYGGGSTISGGTVAFSSGALGSSGNVTVNNAALRWASGNTQDISSRLALVNAATATLDIGSNDVTLASGFGAGTSGAVTKVGAGTLTLTGSNGYTGLTTVSGGTLQIGVGGSTGSVGGDIANAGTLTFNRSNAYSYAGLISGAGDVRQIGSGTTTLGGSNTFSGQLTVAQGAVAVATVNNASANGPLGNSTNSVVLGSTGATGLLAYTGATNSSSKRFTLASGGTAAIDVQTAATTLTLSGSIDGSGAFVKQGAGTLSLSGSSPFTGNVTIASGTMTAGLTVNTSSPTATSLGNMTSAGRTITVNSGATLVFTAADAIGQYNYTTPVTLIADGGTITRTNSGAGYFNAIGNLELKNGGRLTTANGGNAIVESFGLNGNVTVSGTSGSFIDTTGTSYNGVNLGTTAGSNTFTVNSTGDATADLTVSAPLRDKTLGGAASVVKAGAGKMLMTGTSTYTGNTTINAGTFAVGTGGQIYSGAYSGSVLTVGSGATLDLQNWAYGLTTQNLGGLSSNATSMVVSGGTIRISGAGSTSYGRGVTVNSGGVTLDAAAGATWTIDTVTDSQAWVYNGNPSITLTGGGIGQFDKVLGNGSGGLTKSGTGTWTLTGVNTFSGNTTISAGTLVLGGAGQLGGGAYGGNISNAGALQISTSANQTLSGVVSGAGAFTKSGAGTLALTNASNSFSGGATISAGVLSFANDALGPSGAVTMNGGTLRWESGNTQDVSSRLALVNSTTTTLDVGSNDVTLANGVGAGSSAGLVKAGAGALTLSSSNGFSGGLSVTAGTIRMGNDAALGTGGISLANGAAISSADTSARTIANAVAVNGDVTLGDASNTGSLTFNGPLDFGGQTRQLTTPSNVTIAAALANAGGLTKDGAGTLTLSAANTYTGNTTINAGSLALSGLGDISSGSASLVTIAAGATLDISAASGARTIGALAGGDGTSQVLLGGNTLRSVITSGNAGAFGGVISGAGGFTKAGTDELTLTSLQAFTGVATVEAGNLLLASGTGLATASRIFVGSGATIEAYFGETLTIVDGQTLGGYGTVKVGVTLNPGATVSPGGSIGNLTVNGTVTFSGTSGYKFEVTSGTAGAGIGWDLLTATSLTITSTPQDPFRILLTSLTSGTDQNPGSMTGGNWDPGSTYEWLFVTTSGTISTFDANAFTFDQSNFDPYNTTTGGFAVVRGDMIGKSGTDLYITYIGVPEPGTLALAGIGLAAAGWAAARRRRRLDRHPDSAG